MTTSRVLSFFLLVSIFIQFNRAATAQSFVIQFRAANIRDGSPLTLDSIRVRNLSRGKDTTLIGVTSLVISVATSLGEMEPAPEEFTLSNNFSNPFSNETRVRLSVGESDELELNLHDLFGRRIITWRERVERGAHEFQIDGSGLLPGAYLLSAHSERMIRMIRMVKSGAVSARAASLIYLGRGGTATGAAHSAGKSISSVAEDYRFIGYLGGFAPDTISTSLSAGGEYTFSIHADRLPLLATVAAGNITAGTAGSGGRVTSDGGFPVTSRGVCWNPLRVPTIADDKTEDGAGAGDFTSLLSGLSPRTMYFVRAYAVNGAGVGYGPALAFVTAQDGSGTFADIDGNVYQTLVLGTQTWMAENLNVTRARTGDTIPNVPDAAGWRARKTAAWCHYDNDPAKSLLYGRLYNYFAAADSPDIAPAGWHVPSDDEWQILVEYLGGDAVAGGRMKEPGTAHWLAPNTGATNESGFTGLGAGRRDLDGFFIERGAATRFWSTTANHSTNSWIRALSAGNAAALFDNENKRSGLSIRCVKD